MKEYVLMIISVSLLCGAVKILTPKSTEMSFAVRIVILCVLLSPLVKVSVNTDDFFVINVNEEHTITNEDADFIWREFMAKITAERLASELETKIFDSYKIKSAVNVPWHVDGENVVFSVIEIVADCDERKCESIEVWVKLNYSLEAVCTSGDVNGTNTEK